MSFSVPNFAVIILGIINLVTLGLWGVDKVRARRNQWRIAERTLMAWSLLGGGLGALLGMLLFRHKIRKPVFWLTSGTGCLIQIVLLIWLGSS